MAYPNLQFLASGVAGTSGTWIVFYAYGNKKQGWMNWFVSVLINIASVSFYVLVTDPLFPLTHPAALILIYPIQFFLSSFLTYGVYYAVGGL